MFTNHFNKLGFKNVWNLKHFRNLIVFIGEKTYKYVFNVQSNLYNLIFLSQTYHSKKIFRTCYEKSLYVHDLPLLSKQILGADHSELNGKIGLAWQCNWPSQPKFYPQFIRFQSKIYFLVSIQLFMIRSYRSRLQNCSPIKGFSYQHLVALSLDNCRNQHKIQTFQQNM